MAHYNSFWVFLSECNSGICLCLWFVRILVPALLTYENLALTCKTTYSEGLVKVWTHIWVRVLLKILLGVVIIVISQFGLTTGYLSMHVPVFH